MTKKFLILTADAGYGHRSAANAIAKALNELYGDECECKIVNPAYEHSAPYFFKRPQLVYDRTVNKSPAFYKFTYDISDTVQASSLVNGAVSVCLYRTMYKLLMDYKPDAIISTYFFYPASLQSILDVLNIDIPCFTIVTDLSNVHNLWLKTKGILFVPSEDVRKQAILTGVPPEKIFVSGIPVNPSIFLEKRSKADIRRDFGWNPDLLTVLLVGSQRVHDVLNRVESIGQSNLPVQLVVIAGGDDAVFNQLKDRQWNSTVHIYNYVSNVTEMMLASDILVSKAGGLIVSEGLACGLPIMLIDALPGQEEGNIEYVCRNRAGINVKSSEEMVNTLQSWCLDQGQLLEFQQNARRIGKPRAAFQIAEAAWNAANTREADFFERARQPFSRVSL